MASGRPQLTPWILGEITSRHHPSIAGKWQARGRLPRRQRQALRRHSQR